MDITISCQPYQVYVATPNLSTSYNNNNGNTFKLTIIMKYCCCNVKLTVKASSTMQCEPVQQFEVLHCAAIRVTATHLHRDVF